MSFLIGCRLLFSKIVAWKIVKIGKIRGLLFIGSWYKVSKKTKRSPVTMQTTSTTSKLELRMQKLLDSFSIPLRVVWSPDTEAKCHGEIKNGFLMLYDASEEDAWDTFTHELIEYKLNKVTKVYREMTNALIEAFQKVAYAEKETFIETMPNLVNAVQGAKSRPPQKSR